MQEFNPAQPPMMRPRPQLGFMEAVKICLTEKYSCFKGRARRSEFWWFVLFQQIVSWVLTPIVFVIYFANHTIQDYLSDPVSLTTSPGIILLGVVSLALLLPSLGASVRRLHDTGRTGKWLLLPIAFYIAVIVSSILSAMYPELVISLSIVILLLYLAMLASVIILIVWWCQDSDRQENAYGPSPKYQ